MVIARIKKFSLWATPRTLVINDNCSCPWVRGFLSNESIKEGYSHNKVIILPLLAFLVWKQLQIGIDLLHTITSTFDGFFRFINIDDLERS